MDRSAPALLTSRRATSISREPPSGPIRLGPTRRPWVQYTAKSRCDRNGPVDKREARSPGVAEPALASGGGDQARRGSGFDSAQPQPRSFDALRWAQRGAKRRAPVATSSSRAVILLGRGITNGSRYLERKVAGLCASGDL